MKCKQQNKRIDARITITQFSFCIVTQRVNLAQLFLKLMSSELLLLRVKIEKVFATVYI